MVDQFGSPASKLWRLPASRARKRHVDAGSKIKLCLRPSTCCRRCFSVPTAGGCYRPLSSALLSPTTGPGCCRPLSSVLRSDLFSSPPLLRIYDLIVWAERRRSEAVNGSQGMALATTMAVSGTVILLAFCRQKPLSTTQFAVDQNSGSSPRILRSCISSDGKKRDKKKKRVHFAADVVDPMGNGEEFRKEHNKKSMMSNQICRSQSYRVQQTPSNRAALYNGILRDRVQPQRMGCS